MLSTAKELYESKKYKKSFLKLVELSKDLSNDSEYLKLLFQVQIKLQDVANALKTVNTLLEQNFTSEFGIVKLKLLFSLQRYNEAFDVSLKLQDMKLSQSENLENTKYLTDMLIYFNDFEGLKELLDESAVRNSEEAYFNFGKGILLSQSDNANEAIFYLRKAVQIDEHLDKAWVALAILHYKMGDFELSMANIEKALDINPYNMAAVKCYSIWKEEAGEYFQAFEKITHYLSHNNFDQAMTNKNIFLMKKIGYTDLIKVEEVKIQEYFGQQSHL